MPEKIWRKNFDIRRVDYQMPYQVLTQFYFAQLVFLERIYLKEVIWIIENMDNSGTYMPLE